MGVEFLDIGLVKIEADHPILDFDSLLARLEEQRPSNWDIPASLEQFKEEIGPSTISAPIWWIQA